MLTIGPIISFHKLIDEGLQYVLTCLGSVGHELAYLDIPVINSGYNPHISYNFNIHPSNIDEYKKIIKIISGEN